MQKVLRLLPALLLPVSVLAQSNALNATGNVGIGVTTPLPYRLNLQTADVAQSNFMGFQHTNIANSIMYLGTASNTHFVENHKNHNLLESHTHFHLSTANASNLYFETGRTAGVPAPVRMMITSTGLVGIGTESPGARFNVASPSNSNLVRFNTTDITPDSAFIKFMNGTSVAGQFYPRILGRGYSSTRPLGILLSGEAEDILPSAGEPHIATTMIQALSKGGTALAYGNVFSVINATTSLLMVKANGNVGIGTVNPGTNKLAVEGTIAARKVKVTQTSPWPDFVFKPEYKLPSLDEVAAHIKAKGHLPGIPTEAEVAKDGQDLGDMNTKLLQKVEELTLYLLDMKANNERLQSENAAIRKRLDQLEKKN